jgi:hypothetical protein
MQEMYQVKNHNCRNSDQLRSVIDLPSHDCAALLVPFVLSELFHRWRWHDRRQSSSIMSRSLLLSNRFWSHTPSASERRSEYATGVLSPPLDLISHPCLRRAKVVRARFGHRAAAYRCRLGGCAWRENSSMAVWRSVPVEGGRETVQRRHIRRYNSRIRIGSLGHGRHQLSCFN